MATIRSLLRQNQVIAALALSAQLFRVNAPVRTAFLIAGRQIFQLGSQDRSLDAVHSRIPANGGMVILFRLPVIAQHANLLC
jgi:hypothetical protein